MNKTLVVTLLGALPVALAAIPPAPFEHGRDVAALMPPGTVVYLEAEGLGELCAQGFEHPLVAPLLGSPLEDWMQEQVGLSLPDAVELMDLWAGRRALPALERLIEGGLAAGVLPGETDVPIFCVAARGDAELWEEVVDSVMTQVADTQGLPRDKIVPPHREIRGVDVWLLGGVGAIALCEGVFLASTDQETLREMIDLGAEGMLGGLATDERFSRARETQRSPETFLWAWLDLEGIEAVAPEEVGELRRLPFDPLAQLLFGASLANLVAAQEGVVEVRFDGGRVDVDLVGVGAAEGPHAVLLPSRKSPLPPLPTLRPHEVARGVVYRDLAAIFRGREELFDAEHQPALADVASGLAVFFGGADVAEEVLPSLSPWIGVVARSVEFDPRAVPDPCLPSVALLIQVDDPESMGPRLVSAVQTAFSLANVKAALKRQPLLKVQVESSAGHSVTYGRYPPPSAGESADLRYNLEPACSLVGETFVIGTHRALVGELVAQLAAGDLEPPRTREGLVLPSADVAGLLSAIPDALAASTTASTDQALGQVLRRIGASLPREGLADTVGVEVDGQGALGLRASLSWVLHGHRR